MDVADLRPINLQTIPDAIRLMNESSRGMSLEYHLDFLSFLALQGYWNFSLNHSLIRYVGDEPAAIILTCVDAEAHEAYTLYWGSVPKFRTRKIAQDIFEACCNRLFEDGYHTLYGVSVPDRPVQRYRFIQATPREKLFDMHARSLTLPNLDPSFRVQRVDATAISQMAIPAAERFDWSQRPNFLRHAAPQPEFFGAFDGPELKAYAAISLRADNTLTLLDLRSSDRELTPGYELLRHIVVQTYSLPCMASHVFDQSYSHQLLTAAGFSIKRQFHLLIRDLRSTCATVSHSV